MPKNDVGNFFDPAMVRHIASLANIPLETGEEEALAQAFGETLQVIANLKELDTTDVQPTFQVTGLENIWREDVIEETRMFSQDQALANAPRAHRGYFVVPQVIDKE